MSKFKAFGHGSSGTKYYCGICGYSWLGDEHGKAAYCLNCYQKNVRASGALSYMQDLLKKGIKVKLRLSEASGSIREHAYASFKENQHVLDMLLFIIAVAIIMRISVYFLIELSMP